jgi:hypothetical protein
MPFVPIELTEPSGPTDPANAAGRVEVPVIAPPLEIPDVDVEEMTTGGKVVLVDVR